MFVGLFGLLCMVGVVLGWPVSERLHVSNDVAFIGGILLLGIGMISLEIGDLKSRLEAAIRA